MERNTGAQTRELAYRADSGLEVSLVWDTRDDSLTVIVSDSRTGDAFDFTPERRQALDAFYHPFAHAPTSGAADAKLFAARGIEDNLTRLRQLGIRVVPPPRDA
jgi:hypothetical protein